MIYVKSIVAGIGLLVAVIAMLTFAPQALYLDLRAIIGFHLFITLATMLAIFCIGFAWQYRQTSGRHASSPD